MGFVHFRLQSSHDWRGSERAETFFRILEDQVALPPPERIDEREPERYSFSHGKLVQLWESEIGCIFLKRRKPYLAWHVVRIWSPGARQLNEVTGGLDERYLRTDDAVTAVLSYFKQMAIWGDIAHGYMCHQEDWEAKNYLGSPVSGPRGKLIATGGQRLEEGLPGIYWANLFGASYVDFFGRSRLEACPNHGIEWLDDKTVLLLSSPTPLEYGTTSVRNRERAILEALGHAAFFDRDRPDRICVVPKFSFPEPPQGGRGGVVFADDPVRMVIANPVEFIARATEQAGRLCSRVRRNLDFTGESLSIVDAYVMKRSAKVGDPCGSDDSRDTLREVTAYYGEVLRRCLGGVWVVRRGSGDGVHPVVVLSSGTRGEEVEYPFTRVFKLWTERIQADGMTFRFSWLYATHSGG